jgi:redox-sensitive bicupin YhaK (pirin superfamily)
MNVEPRYGQLQFNAGERQNRFQLLVSPKKSESTIWINQDAWFSIADIEAGKELRYEKNMRENGVYFFVLKGAVEIDGKLCQRRDGLGLTENETHLVKANTNAELLAIEVPME